ncbi:hypothetical protein D3C84_1230030 [compost metagenome]
METTSITFLKSTLARTDYLSYLTRPSVEQDAADLVALKVDELAFQRDIHAVFRRKGVVRPSVMGLLREIEHRG